jgi:hypothetical protein
MAPAVCVSSTGRAGGTGISASFAAGRDDQGECVWTPTKSALSRTRHTDVTNFGASEDDGSALPSKKLALILLHFPSDCAPFAL